MNDEKNDGNHSQGGDSNGDGDDDNEENGARHMYTCWIPLGDYPLSHGTLVVGEGTHLLSGYRAGLYDYDHRREVPPDFDAWREGTLLKPTGVNPRSRGIWRSTHFHPGDCVIFDIRLIHASTKNLTDAFRISIDTRWKPTREIINQEKGAFNDLTHKLVTG